MKIPKLNPNGFHAISIVFVLVVVGLIGLVGLRVFHLQSQSTAEGQPQTSTVPTLQSPPKFKVFADKESGVQFIYPDVYGIFQEPTRECCGLTKDDFKEYDSVKVSNQPSANYVPGVAGYFTLGSNKLGIMEIASRTFGPKVRLASDVWKVVTPHVVNPENYQPGDEYQEMTRTNARGLNVWTATWTHEGITTYKLHFVTKGILRTLALPPFDSEQYSSTYNINAQAPYDTLYQQIRDSVSLY